MKARFKEYNGCFGIDLEAETLEEAVELVRFSLNKTSKLKSSYVTAYKKDVVRAGVVIGKRKQEKSFL